MLRTSHISSIMIRKNAKKCIKRFETCISGLVITILALFCLLLVHFVRLGLFFLTPNPISLVSPYVDRGLWYFECVCSAWLRFTIFLSLKSFPIQFQMLDYLGRSSDTDSSSPVDHLLSRSRCKRVLDFTCMGFSLVVFVWLDFCLWSMQPKDIDLSGSYALSHVSGLWLQVHLYVCFYFVTAIEGRIMGNDFVSWLGDMATRCIILSWSCWECCQRLTDSSENCCSRRSWEFKSLHFPSWYCFSHNQLVNRWHLVITYD